MSIESLKSQARRHEQKEEWQKALDHYGQAIAQLDQEDQPDSGLHNRVGDVYIKVGNYEKAVEHYDRAIELYRDTYLLNNAIAVCKKIVRHVPGRNEVFRTMGQIRAEQGFTSDARENFLRYAELMQQAGDLDESFRALVEFADLVSDDVDVRIKVADQMLASERMLEGIEQLKIAYQLFKQAERDDRAFGLEARLLELDPDVDFDSLTAEAQDLAVAVDDGFEYMTPYGEEEEAVPAPVEQDEPVAEAAGESVREDTDVVEGALEDADAYPSALVEEPMAEAVSEAWEEAGSEYEEPAELPLIGDADDHTVDDGAVELPLMESPTTLEEDGAEEPGESSFTSDLEDEEEAPRPLPGLEPSASDVDRDVEVGGAKPQPDSESDSESRESPVPAGTEASSEEYVDLSSMIFGDEAEQPKTTRFRVRYEEPTGDEAADFQKMLSQFKEKVSESLDAGDVKAHYDLGTAYKEMGLLDEAISEFQSALRASADHLPTYELMGQTFLEMGKNEAAVKSLERALKIPTGVEDELLGIYYYLARAYETLGKTESAVEFYDRVFSLDINFADVTERLRALR